MRTFMSMLTDEKFLQALGKRIEDTSIIKYKSQREFAEKCNLDPRTIRRIIKASQNPTVLILRRIATALDLTLKELIDLD